MLSATPTPTPRPDLLAPAAGAGRYTLLSRLAVGGMAEIFAAEARGAAGFAKTLAVKRVLAHVAEDRDFVTMLLDEARTAARISHPNVCQVFDLVEDQGRHLLVMEYLEGASVGDLIRRLIERGGRLAPRLAVGIAVQALDGLHAAHELRDHDGRSAGVIHRDVSPGNLFVTVDGSVKLLDFGIARARWVARKTKTGMLLGKSDYMAPEQAKGGIELDRRADVFSLAIVLWEMLVGRRLFRRINEYETLRAILYDDVPAASSLSPEVPAALDAVLSAALAKPRDRRIATARALRDALEQAMAAVGGPAGPRELAAMIQRGFATELDERRRHLALARQQLAQGSRTGRRSSAAVALLPAQPAAMPERPAVEARPATIAERPSARENAGTSPTRASSPPSGMPITRVPLAEQLATAPFERVASTSPDEHLSTTPFSRPDAADLADSDDNAATFLADGPAARARRATSPGKRRALPGPPRLAASARGTGAPPTVAVEFRPVPRVASPAPRVVPASPAAAPRPAWLGWLVVALVLIALAAGAFFALRMLERSDRDQAARAAPVTGRAPAAAPVTTRAPDAAPVATAEPASAPAPDAAPAPATAPASSDRPPPPMVVSPLDDGVSPLPGTIHFQARGPATLYRDHEKLGTLPLDLSLPPGEYKFKAVGETGAKVYFRVRVRGGDHRHVRLGTMD